MFKIGNREVSDKNNPLIIPEIGINHNGSLSQAIKIVDAAYKAGAEIIKHQTHIPEDEMSIEAKKIKPGNSKKNIYSIIKNSSLSEEDEFKLMKYVKKKKMIFLSTPFSRKAVDRLIKFKVPAFKIGSGEMSNFPLLEYVCKFKKPIILSTGMHSMVQVRKTTNFFDKKNIKYSILHTTNLYPTKDTNLRLNSIKQLKKFFPKKVIGLSDHTGDLLSSIVGLTLGANIIEKHFVNNKSQIKGPDISSSIDEYQLKELIDFSKRVKKQIRGNKDILKNEEVTRNFAFSSVVAIKEIKKGDKFSKDNIWIKRPGNGYFKSSKFYSLLGKNANRNIKKNFQLKKKDVK